MARLQNILGVMAILTATAAVAEAAVAEAAGAEAAGAPVQLIHCTDLYHPHMDPDDHWDLATVFALAKAGRLDLLGVCLDYPREGESFASTGDPATRAIAQMNAIAGKAVPAVVGCSKLYRPGVAADLDASDLAAANFLLDTMRGAPQPVCISIVGSSRDVAIAADIAPDLFREKCRGIYLNAGTGTTDPAKGANEEWNVLLEPASYRRIFEIPCPIYWLPCFEQLKFPEGGGQGVSTYGSFWQFEQADILPRLSKPVQNFFLYALTRSDDNRWLRYLYKGVDTDQLAEFGEQTRGMWCTAGFLHMCGLGPQPTFTFERVSIELDETGVGEWHKTPGSNRFIIEVKDTAAYPEAMRKALAAVLQDL